jgi:hypothetical protein
MSKIRNVFISPAYNKLLENEQVKINKNMNQLMEVSNIMPEDNKLAMKELDKKESNEPIKFDKSLKLGENIFSLSSFSEIVIPPNLETDGFFIKLPDNSKVSIKALMIMVNYYRSQKQKETWEFLKKKHNI